MRQLVKFCKMHGLGNDFMVINGIDQPIHLEKFPIKQLANRHLGVGFDQLLVLAPSHHADFFCHIFNSDGSSAEQCGNGMRCIARFIREEKLSLESKLKIETRGGIVDVMIHNNDQIEVSMGIPQFLSDSKKTSLIEIEVNSSILSFSALSLGNPHAIIVVDSLSQYDDVSILKIAKKISSHPIFPNGANVGWVEIINRHHVRLRTIERGVGETYACGSNACAAVVSGIFQGWLDNQVIVELTYGNINIEWSDPSSRVMMTGPASYVFSGAVWVDH